jgi:hypothetical protein
MRTRARRLPRPVACAHVAVRGALDPIARHLALGVKGVVRVVSEEQLLAEGWRQRPVRNEAGRDDAPAPVPDDEVDAGDG